MAKKAQTLIDYNKALHKAHLLEGLYQADKNFRRGKIVPEAGLMIFSEHMKRVKGHGCPADCDEVTDKLTRK